jgi:general secretion pathway protein L
MPQRILAIEVEPAGIKAAVVETSFRDFRIAGLYRVPVRADQSLPEVLHGFVTEHNLQGSLVLSALCGEKVTWRTFFLPFRDRKRLDQTVPYELETQVPFDLEDVVVSYQVLQRDKSGSTVLAALVQRRDLQDHLESLQAAGLDPKIVDFGPLVSLNALDLLQPEPPPTCVFVCGDPHEITVALRRNGFLVGLRTVSPVFETQDPAVEQAADNGHATVLSRWAEDVSREIRWSLLALNGAPLEERTPCVVAGEGIYFDYLATSLSALDLAVQRFDENPLRTVPPELRSNVSPFVTPLGLALRELQPERGFGVNFRQGEFAYQRGREEMRRALFRTGAIAASALVLLLANAFLEYRSLQARLDAVQAQVRFVFQQTLPDVQRIVDERRQLQEEIDAAEKRLKLLGSVAPPSGATAIDALQAISSAVPETLKFEVDEYVMDTQEIKLRAHTDSLDAPNAIREAIANAKYFADVQVKDIKTAADGRVDFRMLLTLNKSGSAAPAAGRL